MKGKKREEYREWTSGEIRNLLEAYTSFNGKRIKWDELLERFPGRSKQQCISFINNHKQELLVFQQQQIQQKNLSQSMSYNALLAVPQNIPVVSSSSFQQSKNDDVVQKSLYSDKQFMKQIRDSFESVSAISDTTILNDNTLIDYSNQCEQGVLETQEKMQRVELLFQKLQLHNTLKAQPQEIDVAELATANLVSSSMLRVRVQFEQLLKYPDLRINIHDKSFILDAIMLVQITAVVLHLDSEFDKYVKVLFPDQDEHYVMSLLGTSLRHFKFMLVAINGGILSSFQHTNHECALLSLLMSQITRQIACRVLDDLYDPKTQLQQMIDNMLNVKFEIKSWHMKYFSNYRIADIIQHQIDGFITTFGMDNRLLEFI